MLADVLTELQNEFAESVTPFMRKAAEQAEEILECLGKLCDEIVDEIVAVVEEIKRQYLMEKPKDWKVPIKQEIRPLYLDKRRKVHRCRNNC